jgi:uncharacterized protein (DUF697 family)
MNDADARTILAIATLAASSDGARTPVEQEELRATAGRFGVEASELDALMATGRDNLGSLVTALSTDEARLAAYDTAAAVCHVNGPPTPQESAFLAGLAKSLGAVPGLPQSTETMQAAAAAASSTGERTGADSETFILDQAMLAGACNLLPNKLATIAILPLQLRMVYAIGKRHGQNFGMSHAKDLVAVLGISAAGNVLEGIIRGVGRGLLGGLVGRAAGSAAGVAVTFATTYALGQVAEQYYAQGRTLSAADLKTQFTKFSGDAQTMFPKVEARVRELASTTDLNSLLGSLRA